MKKKIAALLTAAAVVVGPVAPAGASPENLFALKVMAQGTINYANRMDCSAYNEWLAETGIRRGIDAEVAEAALAVATAQSAQNTDTKNLLSHKEKLEYQRFMTNSMKPLADKGVSCGYLKKKEEPKKDEPKKEDEGGFLGNLFGSSFSS